jgi:hypothetical protein
MFAVMDWFDEEQINVQKINRQHLDEIKSLRDIAKINAWMDKVVKPSLDKIPKNIEASDDGLVDFFDSYSKVFDFYVVKYIYVDENSKNLNIGFSVVRNSQETLKKLMQLKYVKGFLKFNKFKMNEKTIDGEIQVIQPFYGDMNAS